MVLALSACGGAADERADTAASEPAGTQPSDDGDDVDSAGVDTSSPDSVAPLPAECTAGPFSADVRIANAYAELEVIEDPAFAFTDAVAVRLQPGAYSVFLGDYDLDPALFASWETQHPPADHTLVQLYLTTFGGGQIETDPAELVPGDVIVASSEIDGSKVLGLTFERGLAAGDPAYLAYNTSSTPEGQAEVLGINDTHLCLKVDYLDYEGASTTNGVVDVYPEQKRFAATFTAEIIDF